MNFKKGDTIKGFTAGVKANFKGEHEDFGSITTLPLSAEVSGIVTDVLDKYIVFKYGTFYNVNHNLGVKHFKMILTEKYYRYRSE